MATSSPLVKAQLPGLTAFDRSVAKRSFQPVVSGWSAAKESVALRASRAANYMGKFKRVGVMGDSKFYAVAIGFIGEPCPFHPSVFPLRL